MLALTLFESIWPAVVMATTMNCICRQGFKIGREKKGKSPASQQSQQHGDVVLIERTTDTQSSIKLNDYRRIVRFSSRQHVVGEGGGSWWRAAGTMQQCTNITLASSYS